MISPLGRRHGRCASASRYCGHVDEEWLAEARRAQQQLIHAQHEADVARAAFHRAVQRLVMHGAEPQDVAAALGISDRQLYEMAHKAGDSGR
jgi:hypothetical protein